LKQNKFFVDHAMHLATACAIVAIILIIPAAASKSVALGVILYILSALLLAGGGVILYLGHKEKMEYEDVAPALARQQDKNDEAQEEKMSFEDVLEGIDSYLGDYITKLPDLFLEVPWELRVKLEQEKVFRPLVAFRLLWELSQKEDSEILTQFNDTSEKAMGYLCGALCEANADAFADFFYELKRSAPKGSARIPVFFRKNRRYFEEQMTAYVIAHMEEFGSEE